MIIILRERNSRKELQVIIKLKSCPFCGVKAKIWDIAEDEYRSSEEFENLDVKIDVTCNCCKCYASTNIFETPEEAICAWNQRV